LKAISYYVVAIQNVTTGCGDPYSLTESRAAVTDTVELGDQDVLGPDNAEHVQVNDSKHVNVFGLEFFLKRL
jgi:hypothetical protein